MPVTDVRNQDKNVVARHNAESNVTTTVNTYVDVCIVPCMLFQTKHLMFVGATQTLSVQILGSIDGTTFPYTEVAEFDVAAAATVTKTFTTPYQSIKVQVKPKVAATHGTLSTRWFLGTPW